MKNLLVLISGFFLASAPFCQALAQATSDPEKTSVPTKTT